MMAGYPPPYPPPGTPFGFDARQQRRILREQTRAHLRAFQASNRAQRDLYRQQMRANKRSSILGPLVVIAIGVTFFVARLRSIPFSSFAIWFAHWWPVVLIVAGVLLVIEWAIDQHLSTSRGIPVRRGIGAGTVFLLILIALTGASIGAFHITRGFDGYSINPDNIGQFFGERHDRQQQLDGTVPTGTTVEIDDPRGDVTLTGGSPDGQIHVTVNKAIYSSSDSDADRKDRDLTARMNLTGETLKVALPSLPGSSSDLTITLPDTSPVIVNAGRGAVNISAMKAAVNVSSDHGDIDLESIAGAVVAHLNSTSASFHANQIQGQVQLKGRAQDVTLADVSGPVGLDGEFYGDTHLEHLHGGLNFRTDRTQFSLAHLDGEVDISPSSELTGNDIAGPIQLHARNRNISLERLAGDVSVVNSNGRVDLSSAVPLGNVSVENHNGEVAFTVPEKSNFSLDAHANEGSITNDLGLEAQTSGESQSLSAKHGNGGANVKLSTTHADIALHEAAAVALSSAPTPPATKPLAKRKPATTLKSETF